MRVRFKLALLLLGALVLAAVLPQAGGFWRTAKAGAGYDKVVDDGGVNCTSSGGATVYMTINAALAAAVDGDAIFVCAGTYPEPELTMSVPNVTLQGAGPNDVTVSLANLPNTDVPFTITAVGVSLMDMTIDAAPTPSTPSSAYGVNILNANDATVSGNVFINAGVISVRINHTNPNPPPTGATISGNDIEADGSAIGNGITCICNSSSFLGNTFHTSAYPNGILAVDLNGDNLTVSGNEFNGVAVSAQGDGNTVMNNSFSGAQPQHADRFQLLVYGLNAAIIGNTFADSGTLGGGAILASSVTDINTSVSISKNIFQGPATTGIRLSENLPDDQFTLTATINGGTPADANVFMNPQNFNQLLQLNNVGANINAENNDWGLCTAPEIEGKIFHGVDNPALGVVDFDPFLTSASCPTPSPTPSPTPTLTLSPTPTLTLSPTPTPTPSPTATPSGSTSVTPTPTPGSQLTQGDTDCSGVIDARDSLILFLFSAGLPLPSRGADCPDLENGTPAFGDLNCDGVVDAGDGLGPLAFAAEASFSQEPDCTPLGNAL